MKVHWIKPCLDYVLFQSCFSFVIIAILLDHDWSTSPGEGCRFVVQKPVIFGHVHNAHDSSVEAEYRPSYIQVMNPLLNFFTLHSFTQLLEYK